MIQRPLVFTDVLRFVHIYTVIISDLPPGGRFFFFMSAHPPGGEPKRGGESFFFPTLPRGDIYPEGKQEKNTPHMKHGQNLQAAVQEGEEGGGEEGGGREGGGSEGGGEEGGGGGGEENVGMLGPPRRRRILQKIK